MSGTKVLEWIKGKSILESYAKKANAQSWINREQMVHAGDRELIKGIATMPRKTWSKARR
jgi:hypothetical protein